jgi:glycosyltransferase involved in cell wall biosynthesis
MVELTFIICTRNRALALPNCLDAIAASLAHAQKETAAEIVCVDNGSTDTTEQVIRDYAANCPIPIRYVFEPRRGLSAARNAGIRNAAGDAIVFVDDDCRISPAYVREACHYLKSDGDEAVMRSGTVVLGDPRDLPVTIKPVAQSRRWSRPMSLDEEASLLGGALIGCNMLMRRAVIDTVGFFDEHMGAGTPCPAGEDTDYFYRAYLAGVTLESVPDLSVAHHHGRRLIAERSQLLKNYALGNGALCAKYLKIYPRFSRHLLWAFKAMIRSPFTIRARRGEWISPRATFCFMATGAVRYLFESRIRTKTLK